MTDRDHNYSTAELEVFVNDLSSSEQKLMRLGGALPATFAEMEPKLTSSDVATMIEIAEEQDK